MANETRRRSMLRLPTLVDRRDMRGAIPFWTRGRLEWWERKIRPRQSHGELTISIDAGLADLEQRLGCTQKSRRQKRSRTSVNWPALRRRL